MDDERYEIIKAGAPDAPPEAARDPAHGRGAKA